MATAPAGKCMLDIPGFGKIKGFEYANGVRQFCGIPYATLGKRWTRSKLNTNLTDVHDGTKLGPRMPHPEFDGVDIDELTPVPQLPHLPYPTVDELNGLNMNIVLPPTKGPYPIFVYVHGGSLLYGGAYLAIFDAVNLVSQSVREGRPIIAITFNYRVGLGGFLAGRAIADELRRDGFEGCGNFGFTDQQVALAWVQRFGRALDGDIGNVTLCGESAGGISISNQLLARTPPVFHRAVCMSGLAVSIPAWTMQEHQELFDSTCQYFHIDPRAEDVLERLRDIPEQELANACPEIFGVGSGTGNPCIDGWFYESDPGEIHCAPAWLQSYMIGDVYHEGVIFHLNIMNDPFKLWRKVLCHFIKDEAVVDQILKMYGLDAAFSQAELIEKFEHMAGDAIFRLPNLVTATLNPQLSHEGNLWLYHFDQRSRIKNSLEGTAYHAYELLYLFKNGEPDMNAQERQLAENFASSWIAFSHGQKPWSSSCNDARQWKIWGPNGTETIKSEDEDEQVRRYSRMKTMLEPGDGEIWKQWLLAIDAIVNKRWQMFLRKADFDIKL